MLLRHTCSVTQGIVYLFFDFLSTNKSNVSIRSITLDHKKKDFKNYPNLSQHNIGFLHPIYEQI